MVAEDWIADVDEDRIDKALKWDEAMLQIKQAKPFKNDGQYIKTVFTDASPGYRNQGFQSGIAWCTDLRFWSMAVGRCGINKAEYRAFKEALRRFPIRPIRIITDSEHVVKQSRSVEDVVVEWKKRCTTLEMRLVDTLSKLSARTGMSFCGYYKSEDLQDFTMKLHIVERQHSNDILEQIKKMKEFA